MNDNNTIKIPVEQTVNERLNEVETLLGRTYIKAMPTYLTIVLGNGCNIDCLHCYQVKNGDNLLRDPEIGTTLRRELSAFYPFLTTLRIQGGEIFALKGFKELVADVATIADHPIISISTNGTLIDENWVQMIIDAQFQSVTVSLDAATPETYAKIRRGGQFDEVIKNIQHLQDVKQQQNRGLPKLDSFFVVMRSNYREIPQYLQLMHELGIRNIIFQTLLIDDRNLSREPTLPNECLSSESEVRELHTILHNVVDDAHLLGQKLVWSGFNSLFGKYNLDTSFLNEDKTTLTPSQLAASNPNHDDMLPQYEYPAHVPMLPTELMGTAPHCTNPWKTMFITENGDVSICFLSEPVGNLFETPLIEIWNSPAAIAKRSRMIAGQYMESGCSKLWCDWREGTPAHMLDSDSWHELLKTFAELTTWLKSDSEQQAENEIDTKLRAVRQLLSDKQTRIKELEANLSLLWDDNMHLHQKGQQYIDSLEEKTQADQQYIALLEARVKKFEKYAKPLIWLKRKLSK
ncbi:radical SAM protein [Candidatus Albibeggiatoa sp. nov. NOAA]|uniref:radical SAM protein n=1 Tax=Candidatus Albibeggiatoa sp. nov. NOAA TaxID=3162724 RepID=UPI0032F429BA|nr:radical SAM protein [Thiotrichaceae bacterium]